jgi:hypothetical protein
MKSILIADNSSSNWILCCSLNRRRYTVNSIGVGGCGFVVALKSLDHQFSGLAESGDISMKLTKRHRCSDIEILKLIIACA